MSGGLSINVSVSRLIIAGIISLLLAWKRIFAETELFGVIHLKKFQKIHRESKLEKKFGNVFWLTPPLPPWRTVGTIQHCLHLTSAYTHFLPQHGLPEVTTMPLGLGTTVDYIFFSADSCENGNGTGKPSGSWVSRILAQESLEQLRHLVRHFVAWHGLLGLDQLRSGFHSCLALVMFIILSLDYLSVFSFYPSSIREKWAEQSLSIPILEIKIEH